MKTEEEIRERLDWAVKALDDPDNDTELQQIKLWTQIDTIKWILGG